MGSWGEELTGSNSEIDNILVLIMVLGSWIFISLCYLITYLHCIYYVHVSIITKYFYKEKE